MFWGAAREVFPPNISRQFCFSSAKPLIMITFRVKCIVCIFKEHQGTWVNYVLETSWQLEMHCNIELSVNGSKPSGF